jgi:hypothetical protein
MEFTIEGLKNTGFKGFIRIGSLKSQGCDSIPRVRGFYVVLRDSKGKPIFLNESIGGHFKNRIPTISLQELEQNWVNGAITLYIGQTGTTLFERIRMYINFGKGKKVPHWGGRLIWQLANSDDLIIAWKPVLDGDPEQVETEMIGEFRSVYGKRPFANLTK